jgi:hypothetical protein
MSIAAIVWIMLVAPSSGFHDVTVGGVFTSRQLCETASKEVPEEGLKFKCVQRQLWSGNK